jgi:hypothetical protein
MWAEKRHHEWLGGVLGVLGLAPSTHISQIKQKVLKGYAIFLLQCSRNILVDSITILTAKTLFWDAM